MTIYKPNNPDRKQEKKLVTGPEVVIDDKLPLTTKSNDADMLLFVRRHPITNTEVLRRRRCIHCVLFMMALILVVTIALISALFLFKHIHRPYMGQCQVTYEDSFPSASDIVPQPHSFQETYEVDGANSAYERLEVPPILDFRRSTVVHDFDKNLTAIVDRDHGRCYILPLNRAAVQPPKNFLDLLEKFKSGYYVPNAEIVRENYKVMTPAVDDLEPFGVYIWADCQFFDTYHLVKDDEPIAMSKKKRSLSCTMQGDGFCLGDTFVGRMTCLSLHC